MNTKEIDNLKTFTKEYSKLLTRIGTEEPLPPKELMETYNARIEEFLDRGYELQLKHRATLGKALKTPKNKWFKLK